MTWTIEDDERELRLYVSRKLKENGETESLNIAVERYRKFWDMLPGSVRRTINTFSKRPDMSKRRNQ